MLWKSCSKFNFLQVFHSMFCKKIDILAVAKEKLCIATIFIRLINHLEIVIDIKYQYYQTIFRYKKAFLRFGCFCSNATVSGGCKENLFMPIASPVLLPFPAPF